MHPGEPVDRDRFAQQAATRHGILFDQDHPPARLCRAQRSGQPCGPCTHHQHIAKRGAMAIAIGIGPLRRLAQPGRAADEPLVKHPQLRRAEKRLVIEPCGQHRRQQRIDHAHIEFQRRPHVLAGRDKPRIQKHIARAHIGFGVRPRAQRHQRRRFLDPHRDHTARAVVFETSRDHAHAIGHQRGGQRIARLPHIAFPVECERHFAGRYSRAGASHSGTTSLIACVKRLRVRRSHWPHMWLQIS